MIKFYQAPEWNSRASRIFCGPNYSKTVTENCKGYVINHGAGHKDNKLYQEWNKMVFSEIHKARKVPSSCLFIVQLPFDLE